jgi:hypothetical protein
VTSTFSSLVGAADVDAAGVVAVVEVVPEAPPDELIAWHSRCLESRAFTGSVENEAARLKKYRHPQND